MTQVDEALPVLERHTAWAAEADDGAINVARALSARVCGASQSEMRAARKAYLAELFARFEASLATPSPSQTDGEARRQAAIALIEDASGDMYWAAEYGRSYDTGKLVDDIIQALGGSHD